MSYDKNFLCDIFLATCYQSFCFMASKAVPKYVFLFQIPPLSKRFNRYTLADILVE